MDSETDTTAANDVAVPAAAEASAPKERGKITISLADDSVAYTAPGINRTATLTGMPVSSVRWLALNSLGGFLARDAQTAIAELHAGRTPGRVAKPKPVPILDQAIAQALVEITKKTSNPISIEDAAERVAKLTKKERDDFEGNTVVNKHLAKLRPAPDLMALVA